MVVLYDLLRYHGRYEIGLLCKRLSFCTKIQLLNLSWYVTVLKFFKHLINPFWCYSILFLFNIFVIFWFECFKPMCAWIEIRFFSPKVLPKCLNFFSGDFFDFYISVSKFAIYIFGVDGKFYIIEFPFIQFLLIGKLFRCCFKVLF